MELIYFSLIKRLRRPLLMFCLVIAFNLHAQKDTLSLLHISDTHLMFNLENYDTDIVHHREHTRGYKGGNVRFEKFMQTAPIETGSDMIIATGDLIDFFSATTTEGEAQEYQVEQFARLLDDYPQPLLLTLGNHDIFSYNWGKNKVIPNQLETGRARATWIRNFDCFRDGTYYSRTFEVGKTNYRLIFLDNSFYRFKKEENMVNPYIDKPQLHWLKDQLNKTENEIVIILMHLQLTEESALPESNNELYAALSEASSVKLILAGHFHKGSVKKFPTGNDHEIVQVGTDALVNSADNWRLIHLTEDDILVSSMGTKDNQLSIPVK